MRARFAAVGVLAVSAELALGAIAIASLGPVQVALYPLVCALATAVAVGVLWRLLAPRPDGGGGGRGGTGPDRSPSPEPEWWPEFERDLREYTRRLADEPAGQPR